MTSCFCLKELGFVVVKVMEHPEHSGCSITLRGLYRTLPPGVVDAVFPIQDDLRNRHKGITFLKQAFDDPRQRLRCMERRIVKQYDGTRLDLACHSLGDLPSRQIFPIQAVPTGSSFKNISRDKIHIYDILSNKRCQIHLSDSLILFPLETLTFLPQVL